MSSFKPGDVVLHPDLGVGLVQDYTPTAWVEFAGGQPRRLEKVAGELRPLVVIDPEDREQIERLMTLYAGTPLTDNEVPDMQAALRKFASPKPDEPKGDYAVIKDGNGYPWTRLLPGGAWVRIGADDFASYADIPGPITVLCVGVEQ